MATYLFVGNGAKLQYKDMDAVRQCLGEVNTENYNFQLSSEFMKDSKMSTSEEANQFFSSLVRL